jgi:hypothetical protein
MIAELAAANAAFAVIKATIANGGELVSAGRKVVEYFDSKAKIQERATMKAGGRPLEGRSDIEEFMALEQLRQQEEHLRESMVYAGRPGMWDDWIKFQAEAARGRREAKESARRAAEVRKKELEELAQWMAIAVAVIVLATLIVVGVAIVR